MTSDEIKQVREAAQVIKWTRVLGRKSPLRRIVGEYSLDGDIYLLECGHLIDSIICRPPNRARCYECFIERIKTKRRKKKGED